MAACPLAEELAGAPPLNLVDNGPDGRTVKGMKLLSILTIAALSALTFSTTASAQDAEPAPVCGPDRTLVMSAGGPLCIGDIYLDGSWNDDPATCSHGYYQGSCAPAPQPSEPLPVEAYLYQMNNPSPAYVAEVEVKLGKLDRIRSGLTALLG